MSFRKLLRRWVPLVYLIPVAYLFRPIFWTPLDGRFYNFFLSKRGAPRWSEVVVVGIDKATAKEIFGSPAYPLSRHTDAHARLTTALDEAGVRAIVFDLRFTEDVFDSIPSVLAESFRSTGNVYLVASLLEEQKTLSTGERLSMLRAILPDSNLIAASEGAYIADVSVDPDGILRRYSTDPRIDALAMEALPEHIAGLKLRSSVPIEFPSVERPLPVVSYRDVLRGKETARAMITGRIAFIGSILDESTDYISVPRLQSFNNGRQAFRLPGVAALAAITENLMKGTALRDATWREVLSWNLLWCLLAVAVMPRKRPVRSSIVLAGVIVAAMLLTGALQIKAGLIIPAGLLMGCLLLCGGHALISSHITTAKELFAEEAENERVRREMELARITQVGFLPKEIPSVKGIDIWGTNISSLVVSGDYYDVIALEDKKSVVLAVADVSGKGLPASLLMSNVQAGLRSHLYQEHFDLTRTAKNLNRLVCENTEEEVFITMFLSQFSTDNKILRYVRAGHEMPFVVSGNGEVQHLEVGGIVLGFLPDTEYESGEVTLKKGDVLCLYTDGATEARDADDNEFGIERLVEVVRKNQDFTSKTIGEAIVKSLRAFSHLEKQSDDVTLVVVKIQR